MQQSTDVAAYIWPAYTGKEPRSRMFWPEGSYLLPDDLHGYGYLDAVKHTFIGNEE